MPVLIAPTPYANFQTGRGATYTADANGVIYVANLADLADLENAGCSLQPHTGSLAAAVPAVLSASGTDQASAAPLKTLINIVVAGDAGAGVRLDPSMLNERVLVLNKTANPLHVYPPHGAQWDDCGADLPISVDADDGYDLILTSDTQGYTY